jgi:hypothetical protein
VTDAEEELIAGKVGPSIRSCIQLPIRDSSAPDRGVESPTTAGKVQMIDTSKLRVHQRAVEED